MIESEDWGKLYYAIVHISKANVLKVIGIGSTKLICRNSALNTLLSSRRVSYQYASIIENLDIGSTRFTLYGVRYAMVYCEAKVYIYGKRYGYDRMKLVYDPTYREELIRFAGFRRKEYRRK